MTLKWQLLVARSGISKNRLSLYPSRDQAVSVCRVLDSRATFCTRHLTARVGSRSCLLPGGSQVGHAGLCSCRRLDFLRQHRVIFGRAASRLKRSSCWAVTRSAVCTMHWADFKIVCTFKMPASNASPVSGCSVCRVTAHTPAPGGDGERGRTNTPELWAMAWNNNKKILSFLLKL